uniref:DUF423 domain-containing protein n=1 Tax=Acidicaldus sp. TaxID=1872105 RepID=A0A8J4M7W1_9PROT
MARLWIALGALYGLLGVAMAAYGAHAGLDDRAASLLGRASEIALWHAPALLFAALWRERAGRLADAASLAFALGVPLFSGAVAALALGLVRHAAAAPFGGSLLMLGWALLAISAARGKQD